MFLMVVVVVQFIYLVSVDILGGAKGGRFADLWRFFSYGCPNLCWFIIHSFSGP